MLYIFLSLALSKIAIVPYPVSLTEIENEYWILIPGMQIGYEDSLSSFGKELANFISDSLYTPTGIRLSVVQSNDVKLGIQLSSSSDDEYHLLMDSNIVKICGKNRELLFNGFQTLLQLLPAQIYSNKTITDTVIWQSPCVIVHDKPRFQWRGLMVDISRRFFDVDTIKSIIDGMSHFKLNVLHLHITDDQGWRIEMAKYPNLTTIGSYREASPKKYDRSHTDGIPYGPFYYSISEFKDLIEYSKQRSVTIVPEIEMPGHSLCLLSCFPQYSCTGGPFKPKCLWGPDQEIICAGNDEAISFLEGLLDDILDIFDSVFIHCGGDEVIKTRWQRCPKCSQRMKDNGLLTYDQLQGWFTAHFSSYLASKGRRLIGWDEILDSEYELPKSTVVMTWNGLEVGLKAARLGLDVILSPSPYLYLDYYQFAAAEQYEYFGSFLNCYKIHSYDPLSGLEEQYHKHILGVQGNIWSAYIWSRDELQYKTFPRCLSVAEIAWAEVENKNWLRFLNQYANHENDVLHYLGVVDAGMQYGNIGSWKKGDLTENKWILCEFPVDNCLNAKGHIEAAFINKGGESDCHVKNVKFLFDSVVVAEDDHESVVSDDFDQNPFYTFNTSQNPNGKISIQCEMMCIDGDDCEGLIYVYAVEKK